MSSIESMQSAQLNHGLVELFLALPEEAKKKLIQFLSLLTKWNNTYNLTAITEPEKMVTHHLLDSLAIQKFLQGHRIIDVGTGAGLPGIPLAIVNTEKHIVLLDSLTKRTTFLQQACYQLKLENVEVINCRVQDYQPELKFDQIITRAYATLPEMLKNTQHLAAETAQFLAMKGANFQEELELIPDTYTIVAIHNLNVPGLEAKRHLIVLEGSHSG